MKTIYERMVKNVVDNSDCPIEAMELFSAFKNHGIGLTPGFVEERMDHTLEYGSKEHKKLRKIIEYSYNIYNSLDSDTLNYENEFNEEYEIKAP